MSTETQYLLTKYTIFDYFGCGSFISGRHAWAKNNGWLAVWFGCGFFMDLLSVGEILLLEVLNEKRK